MGLVHVTYNSVMQASNMTIEPQPEDAQALAALWGTCSAPDAGP